MTAKKKIIDLPADDPTKYDADLDRVCREWIKIGTATESDYGSAAYKAKTEEAIRLVYQCAGFTPPTTIEHFPSPHAAARRVRSLTGESGWPANQCFGSHEAGWLSFYAAFREIFGLVEETDELRGLFEAAKAVGWYWPFDTHCFVSARPTICKVDEQGELHSTEGPAYQYLDGEGTIYAWHGIELKPEHIEKPLTADLVIKETNAEVRRALLNILGEDQFIAQLGVKPVAIDDFGQLYVIPIKGQREPLTLVRVVNGTPLPDGSDKIYWLDVAPDLHPLTEDGRRNQEAQALTARNAVASTYGLLGTEYTLTLRT